MKIVEVDPTTLEVVGSTKLLAWPRIPAFSPDGKRLYQTIRWLNGALVIDTAKRTVVDRIALGESKFAEKGMDAHGLAVTPDGSQLWISTQTLNEVTVLGTSDHKIIMRIPVGHNPNWVAFTPDGARAIISNTTDGTVSLVDVPGLKAIATVKVGASPKRLTVGLVMQ